MFFPVPFSQSHPHPRPVPTSTVPFPTPSPPQFVPLPAPSPKNSVPLANYQLAQPNKKYHAESCTRITQQEVWQGKVHISTFQ